MYEIIKIINSTLRDQAFSNPFEYVTNNQLLAIWLFAFLGSNMLRKNSLEMCGVFYKRRSNKTLGSIGYMFFYCINVQVLIKLCQWFQDVNLVISIYMLFVIALFIVLYKVKKCIKI